jgi:CheY-like chemotaxis protein
VTAAPRRPKILLVDDRPENLVTLQAILQSLDLEILTATSGEQALKQLLVEDVAAILLDVQMPGMDGFETAEHIKHRERTRHIPIIFLTAIDREPDHTFRGYAVGAVDYLAKPFDPWVLRAKVSILVELYEKARQLEEHAAQLSQQIDLDSTIAELEELARAADNGLPVAEISARIREMARTLRDR